MPQRTERQRRKDRKRKAMVRNARTEHTLTTAEWYLIRFCWDFKCAYCGTPETELDKPIEKDCVVPIARQGRYTLENVVPACRTCNASKAGKKADTWMRGKLRDYAEFSKKQQAVIRLVRAACPIKNTSAQPAESQSQAS